MIFNMLTSSRKNLGMIEIVPHWKIGPQLLCGRMYAVLKNLFFNSKLDLFLVLKVKFLMWFLDSPPKKVQRCKFSWTIGLIVIIISLHTENSKWRISEKKILKLPKFQKLISQEPFRVRWKNFAHFYFLLVGTFEQNLALVQ